MGIAILRHNQGVGRLDAKRLMTLYAPQLRGRAMQRHPVSATRADGIGSERCPSDDCPLAGAGVRDFEAVVWHDHGAVAHHHDRFLGTGAEHGVPRATAERAFYINHQAGPPFCWRISPALPCTHGTPRPNLRKLHVLHTPYYGLVLRLASKVALRRSVVEWTLVRYSVAEPSTPAPTPPRRRSACRTTCTSAASPENGTRDRAGRAPWPRSPA